MTICFCHWQAFKHGNVDLPAEGATMPDAVITLPDNFNGADFLGGLSIECALSYACAAAYHQHLLFLMQHLLPLCATWATCSSAVPFACGRAAHSDWQISYCPGCL